MPLASAWTAKAGETVSIAFEKASTAIVSWNAPVVDVGRIDVRVRYADESWSTWLGYAERTLRTSQSFSETSRGVRIAVDTILAEMPMIGIEIAASRAAAWFAVATPPAPDDAHGASEPIALDVPRRAQYVGGYPYENGWCSPASLAMLLAYRNVERTVDEVARAVFDERYDGAGNWAFNAAYAGSFGLAAAVVSLNGFTDAARFLAADIPIAVSYAWDAGELDGAPIDRSEGHLAVLRGFDARGNVLINDPAHPEIAVTYDRSQFAHAWSRSAFTAYAVDTDRERLIAVANA